MGIPSGVGAKVISTVLPDGLTVNVKPLSLGEILKDSPSKWKPGSGDAVIVTDIGAD